MYAPGLFIAAVSLSTLAAAGAATALLMGSGFRKRLAQPAVATVGALAMGANIAPRVRRVLAQWGTNAGQGALGPGQGDDLRRKLVQAGFRADNAPQVYFGIRTSLATGLGLIAALTSALGGLTFVWAIGAMMLSANLGLYGPQLLLKGLVARRKRGMQDGLPDALDLLVVGVEAGATVSAALQRVVGEFVTLHPVVSEEFGLMLMEMQAGASRSRALTRLAERSSSNEVRALTTLLVQSEAVGASLGQALRVFAQEMRKTRYLEAERKAAELPVKMAFPLVFCIFPCLISLIFIPVALALARTTFGQ